MRVVQKIFFATLIIHFLMHFLIIKKKANFFFISIIKERETKIKKRQKFRDILCKITNLVVIN